MLLLLPHLLLMFVLLLLIVLVLMTAPMLMLVLPTVVTVTPERRCNPHPSRDCSRLRAFSAIGLKEFGAAIIFAKECEVKVVWQRSWSLRSATCLEHGFSPLTCSM